MNADPIIPATRFEKDLDLDLRFPPLPRTITEVTKLQGTGVPDTQRLGEVVNADPVIGASVLRRINSAYYGLSRRVGDVKRAVRLLGFNEVCNIVTTAGLVSLKDAIAAPEQEVIFDSLMRLSIGSAFFADKIATTFQLPLASFAFTTALLHPIGRLTLLYNRPHDYEALWYTAQEGTIPTASNERSIFGIDHAQVARMACESWELPLEMIQAVGSYLAPTNVDEVDGEVLALTIAVASSSMVKLGLYDKDRAKEAKTNTYEADTFAKHLVRSSAALHRKGAPSLSPDALQKLINDERQRARTYIEAMVS